LIKFFYWCVLITEAPAIEGASVEANVLKVEKIHHFSKEKKDTREMEFTEISCILLKVFLVQVLKNSKQKKQLKLKLKTALKGDDLK
jgi:hypothetical protein